MKREKTDYENINLILKRVIKDIGDKYLSKVDENHSIRNDWDDIVGSPLCKHSKPKSVRKGVLTVTVDSSPWMHEMKYFGKNNLLEIIQQYNSEIKDIRFKIGKII